MKQGIGIIKEIDALGRLVIPKEYRERMHLDAEVELVLTTEGLLIRSPKYDVVKRVDHNEKRTDP